ncbi:hypothetical protein D3C75_1017790 [compost metagenome]
MLAAHGFHVLRRLGNYRFRSQEPVAPAYISGADTGYFQINDLLAEQGHKPADRTNEFEVISSPPHILREGH